jgi:hypothetical protein
MEANGHAGRIPAYDLPFAKDAGVAVGGKAEMLKWNEEGKGDACSRLQWAGGRDIGPVAGDVLRSEGVLRGGARWLTRFYLYGQPKLKAIIFAAFCLHLG